MSALGFQPLFEYPNRCDGTSMSRWASSEFPICRQRNHYSLAININLNTYMENIKNRTL